MDTEIELRQLRQMIDALAEHCREQDAEIVRMREAMLLLLASDRNAIVTAISTGLGDTETALKGMTEMHNLLKNSLRLDELDASGEPVNG
ncbi:MAG: hypothetical protein AAGF60_04135 [Pseudomonadota bacterium]